MGMTATERLRALLDERGVEYLDMHGIIEFRGENDRTVRCYQRPEPLTLDVAIIAAPPEQAIAATLGSCNCSNSERTVTCEYCANGKFDGQTVMMSNHGWQRINFCPNCGRKVEDA